MSTNPDALKTNLGEAGTHLKQAAAAASDALMLSAGRSMEDQMRAGVRLPYWWAMLDAIGREPLWGYGWQQVGAAQQRVALGQQQFTVDGFVLVTGQLHLHQLCLFLWQ